MISSSLVMLMLIASDGECRPNERDDQPMDDVASKDSHIAILLPRNITFELNLFKDKNVGASPRRKVEIEARWQEGSLAASVAVL